ncbi:hypothetical protein F5X97DRAFT_260263 [Nemania serpens]|nr:hypothetical protein F5X97DRAFT_260263 [Nemania serpens]
MGLHHPNAAQGRLLLLVFVAGCCEDALDETTYEGPLTKTIRNLISGKTTRPSRRELTEVLPVLPSSQSTICLYAVRERPGPRNGVFVVSDIEC